MKTPSVNLKATLVHVLHRYHVLLFVILVLGSLAAAVFLLNNIIIRSGDSSKYSTNTSDTVFDKATINRLKQLKTRNEPPTPLDLSGGRNSPFIE